MQTPKKSQEEETSEGEEGPSSTEIHLHRAGTININMPEPSTASRRLAGRWGDGGHVGQGSADQEYQELRSELTRLGNGGHGAESPPAALPPACGPPSPLAGSLHPGPAPTRASYGPAGLRRDDLEERATATIHASVADDPYAAGGSPRHYSSTSRVPAAAAGSPASGSNAVLSALRALQDKISRLQRERDSLSEQLEAARSSLDRERDDWARERGRLEATAKERTREQKLALEREATRRGEAEVTAAKQDERAQVRAVWRPCAAQRVVHNTRPSPTRPPSSDRPLNASCPSSRSARGAWRRRSRRRRRPRTSCGRSWRRRGTVRGKGHQPNSAA